MTRRQDKEQVGELGSKCTESLNQDLFFAPMRAAAEENWTRCLSFNQSLYFA